MALLLLMPILLVLCLIWPVAIAMNGRPFLYGSKRMKSPEQAFILWKIRTMKPAQGNEETVLGGSACDRVTPFGRILRSSRLDELPQIFNVLKGDLNFIGPRPPLPKYVSEYPELYRRVLATKPGITGLATVMLHNREKRILSNCTTQEEADQMYRRRCLVIKARIDMIYQRQRGIGLNCLILLRTITKLFPSAGS